MTAHHSLRWALSLTRHGAPGEIDSLSRSISNARVDFNPHQVDAALFAVQSPLRRGVLLADEVGLGKTIEAGIVIAQRWAERRRRILLILPATLRKQWQQELEEKFAIPSLLLEARTWKQHVQKGTANPFQQSALAVLCSYQFAAARAADLALVPWDLVVVDEAHRLRNIYKGTSSRPSRKSWRPSSSRRRSRPGALGCAAISSMSEDRIDAEHDRLIEETQARQKSERELSAVFTIRFAIA